MEASIDFRRSYANRRVDGPPINRPVTFPPCLHPGNSSPKAHPSPGKGEDGDRTSFFPHPAAAVPRESLDLDCGYLFAPQKFCAIPSTKEFPMMLKSQLRLSHHLLSSISTSNRAIRGQATKVLSLHSYYGFKSIDALFILSDPCTRAAQFLRIAAHCSLHISTPGCPASSEHQ